MKKWVKITLISVGSFLALLITLVVVTCWLVFTPSKLTPIVNSLAAKYIKADTHFDYVSFTFFKTFPNAGLEVHNVSIVNPIVGSPNDTLAHIGSLVVGINVGDYINHNDIVVNQVLLEDGFANIYIDPDGNNNFSIFPPSNKEKSDETNLPEKINLSRIRLHNINCLFLDEQHGMNGDVASLNLDLDASLLQERKGDIDLSADAQRLYYVKLDSVGREGVVANVEKVMLRLNGEGTMSDLIGKVKLTIPKANLVMQGKSLVNDALAQSDEDLLSVSIPFHADLDNRHIEIGKALLGVDAIEVKVSGNVDLDTNSRPTDIDINFESNEFNVAKILQYLPAEYLAWQKNMSVDADVALSGHAYGRVDGTNLPLLDCSLGIAKGRFSYIPKRIDVSKIEADLSAKLDLSRRTASNVSIKRLKAMSGSNKVAVKGSVNDLFGDMSLVADIDGDLALEEVRAFLPDEMPLQMKGNVVVALHANAKMSDITKSNLDNVKATGTLAVTKIDATYNDMHFVSPQLQMAVQMPSPQQRLKHKELLSLAISGHRLVADLTKNKVHAEITDPDFTFGMSDFTKKGQSMEAAVILGMERGEVVIDTINLAVENLKMQGSVNYDSTRGNIVEQFDPHLDVAFARMSISMPQMAEALRLASFQFNYRLGQCKIADADIHWGLSDYHLSGTMLHLEDWLTHKHPLIADISFTSDYSDVDQIVSLLSGMGISSDTIDAQRKEDNVSQEADPFIVPLDMDIDFHTHIKRCVFLNNNLSDLAGNISMRDGKVILDQVGFVCKAARMQLTGIYKSPRLNHLYLGIDFHLLDIQIAELIDMIPYIDTLVPMLKSFDGQADFHLAFESYLDAFYNPKVSTMLGSAAISGKNLVVIPGETFDMISKYLMFNKNTKNKIDSLDVEMTLFRDRIDLYPFLFSMDKYQLCASGIHSLDNKCNYHIELLKSPLPIRLAVDVTGSFPKPKVSLGEIRYNELYNPEKQNVAKRRTLEIKKMVREALERNVR